jgi:ParB-like chromosome segregation protein Spo0J
MANYGSDAIVSKTDLFKVDPRKVEVVEGRNSRQDYGDLEELSRSIEEMGVLNPIHVTRDGDRVLLVDGERRLRATLLAIGRGAAIETIPAKMHRDGMSDIETMFVQLTANTGKPLEIVEEGRAFQRLVDWGLSVADIEKRTGRTNYYVKARLAMVDGCPDLQKAVADGEVTIAKAVEIVKASKGDVKAQKAAVGKAKEEKAAPKPKRAKNPPCELESANQELVVQIGRFGAGEPPKGESEADYLTRQIGTARDMVRDLKEFIGQAEERLAAAEAEAEEG